MYCSKFWFFFGIERLKAKQMETGAYYVISLVIEDVTFASILNMKILLFLGTHGTVRH